MKKFTNHLRKEFENNLFDYLLLFSGGILFLVFLKTFSGQKMINFTLLLFFVSFYIIWAVYHHTSHKNVHLKIIVEYIIIGFSVVFIARLLFNF